MRQNYLMTLISVLLLMVLSGYQLLAQEIVAEPPMDSEWYYDYYYGTTTDKDAEPPCGYTKVETIGKSVRHGKEVVEYHMTHVTKFGSTTEDPFYIHYDGSKAYLQWGDGSLHLLYDLALEPGAEIMTLLRPTGFVSALGLHGTKVTDRDEKKIDGKAYIVQEYQPIDAVMLYGADTIRSYTVTQHIGFSRLEALLLAGQASSSRLVALQGGRLRYYRGGGVSFASEGATTPYDMVRDGSTSFTDHPLHRGKWWYVRSTEGAGTDREYYYTYVYHLTGDVIKQDGKEYFKMERYFSLDAPDTPHKRYYYLRYDAQQGLEYISGMGYNQGKPGDEETILYDYKNRLGAAAFRDQDLSIVGREHLFPFVIRQEIDDYARRRFVYETLPDDSFGHIYSFTWIEGVGWDQGFWPYSPGLVGGEPDLLLYAEDQEGRTYGVKKFINTGIDAPASMHGDEPPFVVSYEAEMLRVATSSLAGFADQILTLYDGTGAVVHIEQIASAEQDVSLSVSLPVGIYFWRIQDAMGGGAHSGKLIVR